MTTNNTTKPDKQPPVPVTKPSSEKDKWLRADKISLAVFIVMFLTLILDVLEKKEKILGSSKINPCIALLKREEQMSQQLEALKMGRERSQNRDSIERYYDFKIGFTNAQLLDIKDSLKICAN